MSKIRVLSDQLANQIAAGEVVERPASVAKELVENSIDAGARRIQVDTEGGGRRLLRVADDGEGMTRDDALLAFERHATSKISSAEDLGAIRTLGFRGEALASIASVARVELITKTAEASAATRVLIEGGRMRDVKDAAHPQGTTISVRDLFFNVPARRKFLRSEATESFHLTNLVTHYALAHPEIAFTLTSNGREVMRLAPANTLRERTYQIFGAEFLENLLEVNGQPGLLARVRGYVSAPATRRTSRDAQYLFINGRFVRDRLIGRAISEGYRAVLPQGSYPAALLFLDVPLAEVDVNVHPAKTEVRFRRASVIADAVSEAVRGALQSAGYVRGSNLATAEAETQPVESAQAHSAQTHPSTGASGEASGLESAHDAPRREPHEVSDDSATGTHARTRVTQELVPLGRQGSIEFEFIPAGDEDLWTVEPEPPPHAPNRGDTARGLDEIMRHASIAPANDECAAENDSTRVAASAARDDSAKVSAEDSAENSAEDFAEDSALALTRATAQGAALDNSQFPPLVSASSLVRELPIEELKRNVRPLGQLADSFIIATDDEGLLLIEQHIAHERILFEKYRQEEHRRATESQNLLLPETFDLTPAQVPIFDGIAPELEAYGFGLMRLSGRTVAIRAVPADLPAAEARNMLAEILDLTSTDRRGATRFNLHERIAARLACAAAVKANTPLSTEKMRWLIDRLLLTTSPTTCPHGRSVILRLTLRDIEKSFHRS